MPSFDVVIIGSGIAALTAAYQLSADLNVIILTKSKKTNSNSNLAQGGIASAIGKDDSWQTHLTDTLVAGCHHNREDSTKLLVQTGPSYLEELIKEGMVFDLDIQKNLQLGKEGAHSTRRIVHAGGDSTGRELILHMLDRVKNRVQIIEDEMAIDLIIDNQSCIGVETKTFHDTTNQYYGTHIILATGGCGGLYSFTSNDESITGDGLAMAYRAGAQLADLEFIQFHPTLLHVNSKGCGLISEAVRGEGAILVSEDGRKLMKAVHPQEDLAPRDVVARVLHQEMLSGNKVYLDISMISNFEVHFPTITNLCESKGIQINKGLIPVIPGAHFSMGGVLTDHRGRTSIEGLYAVGEVACTGVHGANRLASNSLLEGIVFGNLVADDILNRKKMIIPNRTHAQTRNQYDHPTFILPTKTEIQQMMTENVGIVRSKEHLKIAIEWFETYKQQFDEASLSSLTKDQLISVNMITVGWLIATSALQRRESRGGHFREDYPKEDNLHWYKKEVIRTNQREKMMSLQ
ncbi:L-aspartate oxidase [Fredinandcohnia quinoae]|uniref:L-aspartate oxidase n=1 Tax=Fredinandcohnia quinoae TaxID=2918902 RepID=A0AAW5E074_9BACI|nr:L-aspartate oxidase [Fredinandcohnia sp. SECRCQ15]MCH1625708.1 L-aspartate oxidase [Fredinandcohnia sp. SECRCQ15]